MRNKLQKIEYFTMSCGIGGLIGIAIGTTAITVSTVALRTNPFDVIQTHEPLIRKVTRFGLISLGSGLFAFGLGVAVAKHIGENYPDSEVGFTGFSEDEKRFLELTSGCKDCKYFHGQCYGEDDVDLICGIHPYGNTNCPDWEPKTIKK